MSQPPYGQDYRVKSLLSESNLISPSIDLASCTLPAGANSGVKKSHGGFELKFLVDDDRAADIRQWACQRLGPDPHFDPALGDGYWVSSLYLDTPWFDVFHRMPGHCRRKFRIRRYGTESVVYFEQKKKRQGLVRKKRVTVDEAQIVERLQSIADREWEGDWFRQRVDEARLAPACQVVYRRFARVLSSDDGAWRLTIDNQLIAAESVEWSVPRGEIDGVPLLDGQQILELKFRGAIPPIFRQLIDHFGLIVTSFSKYRTGVEECLPFDRILGNEDPESNNA